MKLSKGAKHCLSQVVDAMQCAEELGTTEDTNDYLSLMLMIASEAMARHDSANCRIVNMTNSYYIGPDMLDKLIDRNRKGKSDDMLIEQSKQYTY